MRFIPRDAGFTTSYMRKRWVPLLASPAVPLHPDKTLENRYNIACFTWSPAYG